MIPSPAAPDVRDMAIVHQVFRREFALAPQLLRDLRPDQHDRRAAAQRWWGTVLHAVHHHHTAEDAMIFPVLRERVPGEILDLMAQQHAQVDAATEAVTVALAQWTAGISGAAEVLATAFERALPVLVRHLDDEEREIVPLIARHMTAVEYGRMATSGNGRVERWTLLMSFGAMVEQCSAEDADFMISHLPHDYQQAWYDGARAEYAALMSLLRGGIEPIPFVTIQFVTLNSGAEV